MFTLFVSVAIKSTLVLCVAWLAASVMRSRSAAARHLVWVAAAIAVLALPFLSVSLPVWQVALPVDPAGVVFRATGASLPESVAEPQASPASAVSRSSRTSIPDWRPVVALVWLAGAAVILLAMFRAFAGMWQIRRAAKPFPVAGVCAELAQTLGIARHVDILESGNGAMPMTFGVLRPVVFLPAEASQWSEERLHVVLLHELAHVRRGDVATQLLARTALALCWWNPLAWKAWREFLQERERAADDLVLNAGAGATEYASHLLEVARTMQPVPGLASAAVAMARRPQLEDRLRAILDSTTRRNTPSRTWAVVAAVIAVALAVPLAALQTQESTAVLADVDHLIRAATSQQNFEILDNAADSAYQARQFDAARKLLEAALALRAKNAGEQSVEYGAGLFKLGVLAGRTNRLEDAEALFGRSAQTLGEHPQGARPLIRLGIAAAGKKEYARAFEHFEHAKRIDPAQSAQAFLWMAVVRQAENNMTEAEALYRSAIATQDPRSTEAVTIGRIYERFLRAQGRDAEAAEAGNRASTLQKELATPPKSKSSNIQRIGGAVSAPKLIEKVEPQYSEEARAAKLAGTMVLYVEVMPDGRAHNIQVVQRLGLGLDERAEDAVKQWRFQPGTRDGQPVPVSATVEVNFKLL